MPELPTSAQPWMSGANAMPDVPNRTVNPEAPPNVESGGPDVSSAAPDLSGSTASSQVAPAPPTQRPQFFRTLLFSLGKGLLEGTAAGLQAPLSPQGPAIAAANAPNIPVQAAQRSAATSAAMTSQQMDDLNVAMTQLKLHQLHMVTHQMEEDAQNAVYNRGRDTLTNLLDKGKVDVLASGDLKAVQDEFNKRQADAREAGQGLLPLQILPSAGSDAKKPEFSLVMVGKERLTDDMNETWGASDLGVDQKDFDAAGLTKFSFHASKGMDQQKALQLKTTQYLNWLTKASNQLGQFKRNQATLALKDKSLNQQLQEFRSTQDFKKWQTEFNADVKLKAAALAQDKAPAELLKRAGFAKSALGRFDDALDAMKALEKQGVMGSLPANKLENWIFGKGLVDPSLDNNTRRMIGKLRAAAELGSSAAMVSHTGRTSKEIYDDFKSMLGPGQDWAALRGSMEEARKTMNDYATGASSKAIADLRNPEGGGKNNGKKDGGIKFVPDIP